jgi:hypothetical protein
MARVHNVDNRRVAREHMNKAAPNLSERESRPADGVGKNSSVSSP